MGSVALVPLALARAASVPAAVWGLAALSALIEAAYFAALARAYEVADFSLAYPLARGAAPVLLTLWAALLIGERPTPAGAVGLACVVAGLWLVSGVLTLRRRRDAGAVAAALLVALPISLYSLVDGVAVRMTDPVAYTAILFPLSTLALAPVVMRGGGTASLARVWRTSRGRVVAAGLAMTGASALVLSAFAIAPLGYVGAIRELGIVFAALAGWIRLREPFGRTRTAGAVVICLGIWLLARHG